MFKTLGETLGVIVGMAIWLIIGLVVLVIVLGPKLLLWLALLALFPAVGWILGGLALIFVLIIFDLIRIK